MARRDDLGILVAERIHQRHAEAVPLARLHEEGGTAPPVLAEMEIEAGDDMADAQPGIENAGHELLGALAGEIAGERLLDNGVEAEFLQQPGLQRRRRGQDEERNFGTEHCPGCGSKVSTRGARHAASPLSSARPNTAWWPRWMPSKLPIATIAAPGAPRASARLRKSAGRDCAVIVRYRSAGRSPQAPAMRFKEGREQSTFRLFGRAIFFRMDAARHRARRCRCRPRP